MPAAAQEDWGGSSWLLRRLQAMGPVELGSHAWRRLRNEAWQRRSWHAPAPRVAPRDPWPTPPGVPTGLVELANGLLGGRIQVLAAPPETGPDWHLDAASGIRAPLDWSFKIDYRDPGVVGNAKNIWEKNRHQHLTVLAHAAHATKDGRYSREVRRQLDDWLEQNPFLHGINYSAFECGIRLISWVWIERLLRGTPEHAPLFGPQGRMWPAVYWAQWLVAKGVSKGSSANNHRLGEMTGLLLAALEWPWWADSAAWARQAAAVVQDEIETQFFASGLNREQGFGYHLFSTELGVHSVAELVRHGQPVRDEVHKRLQAAIWWMHALQDRGGNLPNYGDNDDGFVLVLGPSRGRTDFLATVGQLLYRVPARQALDDRAALHLATGLAPLVQTPAGVAPAGSFGDPEAGLFVLATDRGRASERFVIADAGPLGFLSIAAHGHADCLSFTMSAGGEPLFVDPGTYVYHADPKARQYFRGTRAHNTVLVDGQDQSQQLGPFLWGRHARPRVLAWEPRLGGATLDAEHDGYRRLPGAPVHRRTLALKDDFLQVQDRLTGEGEHDVEWRLHIHPKANARLEEGHLQVRSGNVSASLALDPRLQWRIARSEDGAGWYSTKFGVREPCQTLIGSGRFLLPLEFEHEIKVTHAR